MRRPGTAAIAASSFLCSVMAGMAWGRFDTDAGSAGADTRGKHLYAVNCASCHGDRLQGKFAPAVSGRSFKRRWAGRSGQLFGYIAQNMPPTAPGSLDPESYRSITAYIQGATGLVDSGNTDSRSMPTRQSPDRQYQFAIARRNALANELIPIDDASLVDPSANDWPLWRRTYAALGYSPLADIDTSNVHRLTVAWSLALPDSVNEIAPLEYGGILFIDSSGTVEALDAVTGDLIWKYVRPAAAGIVPLSQPRGMALYGTSLFVPTTDNHMIALDARSGALVWNHEISTSSGTTQLTGGPIAVRGKIVQGAAGCSGADVPGGCFVVALDAATGREVWRFNTIARPGEPGGDSWNGAPLAQRFGASVWSSASYDSRSNLVFVGTGQTYHITPLLVPNGDPGPSNAALYTDSTLALNPDTGSLVWYFQHFTRDVWDMDWAFERQLIELPTPDGIRSVVATVGKVGILDVLDATTGRYLFSHDFGLQNLIGEIDPKSGLKSGMPSKQPKPNAAQVICPYAGGARNWPATAYDPQRRTLFVPLLEACMDYTWNPGPQQDFEYTLIHGQGGDGDFGRIAALNLISRTILWSIRRRAPQSSALLATAGGLVFEGDRDRMFRALDSRTGDTLWSLRLDAAPSAFPITFKAGNSQFIAITAGGGGPLDGAVRPLTPEIPGSPPRVTLWVFKLAVSKDARPARG